MTVSQQELIAIFGGTGMMPFEAASIILGWDHLSDAERAEQYGSSDFREALKLCASKYPARDAVDESIEWVERFIDLSEVIIAVSPSINYESSQMRDLFANLDRIIARFRVQKQLLHENKIPIAANEN
jgi:hypothetical protein